MKVVLFCGGFGMRMRSHADDVPKPMVPIGYRPIVWHIMKYYAHYGHTDFVLCLGWKAHVIKQYFLEYEETASNDFVMRGREDVELLHRDIDDWTITFVDTGHSACIGERLRLVREHVEDEPMFFANYADGLTDLHLRDLVADFDPERAAGTFLSVRPKHTFHAVELDGDSKVVEGIRPIESTGVWMNGGFFLFTPEVFDYMRPGEDLVERPFQRMIDRRRLHTYRYEGFWSCMDTYKEKTALDEMALEGDAPWEVWKRPDRAVLRSVPGGAGRTHVRTM